MKISLIWLSLMLLIIAPGWSQVRTFTMQQAMEYALENHNNIKAAMLEVIDAEGNIKEYKATGMPKVSGNVQLQHYIDIPTSIIPRGSFFEGIPEQNIPPNPEQDLEVRFGFKNNITAGLSADLLLFDGSFFVGLQAAKLFKEMVAQRADITKEELAFNVARAYLGVLLARRNADLISRNIDNLQQTLDESIQIFEQGFLEKLDIDRLQLSLNNLKLEQEKVTSLIDLNKNVLKFSIGMSPGEKIEVTGTLDEILPTDYEQVIFDQILPDYTRRPEYLVLQKVDKLNELNIKRIQFEYLPVLKGFGSYSQVLQGNSISQGSWFPTSLVGLTLEVPIFDGFDKTSRIDRAKIERDRNLLMLNDLEKSISLEVENAKIALQNAMKTLESAKQNQVLAQSIYDTSLIKYREGVGSSLEITQAESDLYAAQGRYITSLYELLIAKVDLEKSTGSLLK